MDRYSRTAQVFRRRSSSDGVYEAPRAALPDDPGFVGRLAWKSWPRVLTDWSSVTEPIAAERELAVFCDNSAFDDAPVDL